MVGSLYDGYVDWRDFRERETGSLLCSLTLGGSK